MLLLLFLLSDVFVFLLYPRAHGTRNDGKLASLLECDLGMSSKKMTCATF